jgi:DNA-binding transcriptional LysR family regulator
MAINLLMSMTVFRRVAETGNFSVVAQELKLSQPTVSKQVAALENHLGIKLMNRSTRQLKLTDAGKQYYQHCRQIIDEIDETEANIRQNQSILTGTLRISTPIKYGELHIAPLVTEFLQQHPQLKIDLRMDDHYVDLVKEGIDLAVRVGPLTDSSMVARKLGDFPRVTVASPDYLGRYGTPQTPKDLSSHNCIVFTLLTTQNQWHYDGPNGSEKVQVSGNFTTNNPSTMHKAALDSIGIIVAPTWLINDSIKSGELKPILTEYRATPMEIHVLYPERRFVPARARQFMDFLRDRLGHT